MRWPFEQLYQLSAPLLLLSLKFLQLLLSGLLQLVLEWFFPPQLRLLLLQLLLRLLLTLFFFLLPPLLDLFIHGTGILRVPIAARSIANGDGIPHALGLGRLGGSLLLLKARRLDPPP